MLSLLWRVDRADDGQGMEDAVEASAAPAPGEDCAAQLVSEVIVFGLILLGGTGLHWAPAG
jgi:hypothetical protein